MVALVVAVVGAYLAGSIPFGVVFARARGIDLRKVGSGNIGATNAARALGKRLGFVVFLCDAAKGLIPVLLARRFLAPAVDAAFPATEDAGAWAVAATGAAAFVGHLAPPWLGFKGGKGVATAFGVFLGLAPLAALFAGLIFASLYAATRISSVGSLAAASAFLPSLWLLHAGRPQLALGGFMWLLIVAKHRGNIERLLRRREGKV